MGNKCEVCNKRRTKYTIEAYIASGKQKPTELCWACYRRYMKLKERYLINAFIELKKPYEGNL